MKVKCTNSLCDHSISVSPPGWLFHYLGLSPERFCKRCWQRLDRCEARIKADIVAKSSTHSTSQGENHGMD